MIWLLVILVIIVLLILIFMGMYNGLVRLRNQVKNAWAQIDVQLKRRYDLIPNLVETVKGYAAHEKTVLEDVTQARTAAQNLAAAGPAARSQAEGQLSQALGRLFAVAEAYPDLKANRELSGAAGRADIHRKQDQLPASSTTIRCCATTTRHRSSHPISSPACSALPPASSSRPPPKPSAPRAKVSFT